MVPPDNQTINNLIRKFLSSLHFFSGKVVPHDQSLLEAIPEKNVRVFESNWRKAGDGRHDSMGHSAKSGAYTLFCNNLLKIIHFNLVQVRSMFSVSYTVNT